jgi:SAM-dependent methyltransferase
VDEDVANVEQHEFWNSVAQATHWVESQDRIDALLAPLERRLHGTAAISVDDHVLDVGCGCGTTTRAAARAAVSGDVLGIDLSQPMLERARTLAAQDGLTNASFVRGDAQVYDFGEIEFDVALSRFGVMFFADPVTAFANLARAVRDGGRLVFLCWQELLRNDWQFVLASAAASVVPLPDPAPPDAPGPFAFADADRVRSILSNAGWQDVDIDDVREPLLVGADADDAVAFLRGTGFARRLFEGVDEATVARAMEAFRDALTPYESSYGVLLGSSAWLVSATR